MTRLPAAATIRPAAAGTGPLWPGVVGALGCVVAAALAATPILAQRGGGNAPSRKCMQEVMQLCGRDRSQIPTCLQSKASELSSTCQAEFGQRIKQRMEENGIALPEGGLPNGGYPTGVIPTRTVVYGNDPGQTINVYEPKDAADPMPLVVFIHGGNWISGSPAEVYDLPAHFDAQNLFFASIGHRLLPNARIEDQAADIGAAVQALVGLSGLIGHDPQQVVLIGEASGAHLAALVASDPRYAGADFGAIKGVVLLDGTGFDVPAQLSGAQGQARWVYEDAFGRDPERQAALSPITHVGGPDAPHWLALYAAGHAAGQAQAEGLVAALIAAGRDAKAAAISDTNKDRLSRELGTEAGLAQTEALDSFLAECCVKEGR